jgi:cullin 3
MVRDILMYMDRTYVKQNQKRPVYEMGLAIFCQCCTRAPRVKERLQNLLLDLIKKERDGEKIDRDLVRSVTQMLLDMGKAVFTEDFEQPFLTSSDQYYQMWTESRISNCSTPEYLKNVDNRIQEEAERVKACLSLDYNAGEGGIKEVVESQMIGRTMQALVDKEGSGLVRLLEESRVEDLRRMYDLFSRVNDGQRIILEKMSEHVGHKGKDIVQNPELQAEPLAFVQQLIELKDQYDTLIADAFRGEKSFTNALYKAFELFINQNPRSPEYISLAMDAHLRGSKSKSGAPIAASEEQAEMQLERALQMFRFLQEKDMFEKYYKQHLSRRLLGDRSQSEDMERKVIQMLKNECGYQFTAKLEGMFKDMNTSSDLAERFQQHMEAMRSAEGGGVASSVSVDLQVKVLTTGE